MNDEMLRAAYGRVVARRGSSRADCVSPDALGAVVDGTASESERVRTLDHVGRCRHCRSELELLRTAGDTARQVAAPVGFRVPVWAAAAVVILAAGVALWQPMFAPSAPTLRDGISESPLRLIAPADDGVATAPVTLAWSSVPGARRYEVEILNPSGAAVFSRATTDTTITATASGLVPGIQYLWWVRATLPDGSQPRSLTRRLRITP